MRVPRTRRGSTAILRVIRSRRLAVWLIAGLTLYAFLMTLVPQGAANNPEVFEWRQAHPGWAALVGFLGLHRAWTQPVFLIAATLLTVSIAVCAWDRTQVAVHVWRRWSRHRGEHVAQLGKQCAIEVSSCLDAPEALLRSREALHRAGLRARAECDHVWATQRVWGAFGSPVFHWALASLFVLAALGQGMRWEGKIGVVDGYRKPDIASAYGYLQEGPFAQRRDSAREFEVTSVQADLVVGEVDVGEAAIVTLYDAGEPMAQRLVYSNHLLKYENLLVHIDGTGVGATVVARDRTGKEIASDQILWDYDQIEKGGRIRSEAALMASGGERIPVVIALPLDPFGDGSYKRALPERPRLEFKFPGSADDATYTVKPGQSLEVPGGLGSIYVEDIDSYARLFVVDDWSIPWIYAVLGVACVGAAVALFAPPRGVLLRCEPGADGKGCIVRITPRHRKTDPAFPDKIRRAIAGAVEACDPIDVDSGEVTSRWPPTD